MDEILGPVTGKVKAVVFLSDEIGAPDLTSIKILEEVDTSQSLRQVAESALGMSLPVCRIWTDVRDYGEAQLKSAAPSQLLDAYGNSTRVRYLLVETKSGEKWPRDSLEWDCEYCTMKNKISSPARCFVCERCPKSSELTRLMSAASTEPVPLQPADTYDDNVDDDMPDLIPEPATDRNEQAVMLMGITERSYKTCLEVLERNFSDINQAIEEMLSPSFVDPYPEAKIKEDVEESTNGKDGGGASGTSASNDRPEELGRSKDLESFSSQCARLVRALPTVRLDEARAVLAAAAIVLTSREQNGDDSKNDEQKESSLGLADPHSVAASEHIDMTFAAGSDRIPMQGAENDSRTLPVTARGTDLELGEVARRGGAAEQKVGGGEEEQKYQTDQQLAATATEDEVLIFVRGDDVARLTAEILKSAYMSESERQCAFQCLRSVVRLCLSMAGRGDPCLLATVDSICCNAKHKFYRGDQFSDLGYMGLGTDYPGFKGGSKKLLAELVDRGSWRVLLDMVAPVPGSGDWVGTETCGRVLTIFHKAALSKEKNTEISSRIMAKIETLTDAQLRINRMDNEKALVPVFDGLDALCKNRKLELARFWIDKIDVRFFNSANIHQRLYALGEFEWWASRRADMGTLALSNALYVRELRRHQVVQNIFDPTRLNYEVLRKADKLINYIAHCRTHGGIKSQVRGGIKEAFDPGWIIEIWENMQQQGDMRLAGEAFRRLVDLCDVFTTPSAPEDCKSAVTSLLNQLDRVVEAGEAIPYALLFMKQMATRRPRTLSRPLLADLCGRICWRLMWVDSDAQKQWLLSACIDAVADSDRFEDLFMECLDRADAGSEAESTLALKCAYQLLRQTTVHRRSALLASLTALAKARSAEDVIQDLCARTAAFAASRGQRLSPPCLRSWLQLIKHVANMQADLRVSLANIQLLWGAVGTHDEFFNWLQSLLGDLGRAADEATMQAVFRDLICKISPVVCSSAGFACFRFFFKNGSMNKCLIIDNYTREISSVRSLEWPGKDFLWHVILRGQKDVAAIARMLYLDLLNEMKYSQLRPREVDQAFATIFAALQRATEPVADAKVNEATETPASEQGKPNLIDSVARIMELSNELLELVVGGAVVQQHRCRGTGANVSIRVHVSNYYTTCPGDDFDLNVHGKMTVAGLFAKIDEIMVPQSKSEFYHIGKLTICGSLYTQKNGQNKTLEQLGLGDGDHCSAQWDYKHGSTSGSRQVSTVVRDQLASITDDQHGYLNVLFDAIQCLVDVESEAGVKVASQVWNFIESLPSQASSEHLLSQVDDDTGADFWHSFITNEKHHLVRTIYRMQLICIRLMPGEIEASIVAGEAALHELSRSWRRAFLATGGFQAVLSVLMEPGPGFPGIARMLAQPVLQIGLDVMLRITSFCVFGSLDQDSPGMEQEDEAEMQQSAEKVSTPSPPRVTRSFSEHSVRQVLSSVQLEHLMSRLISIISSAQTSPSGSAPDKQQQCRLWQITLSCIRLLGVMVSNRTELCEKLVDCICSASDESSLVRLILYGTDGKLRYHLKVLLEGVISRLDPATFARIFAIFQQCLGSIEQNKPDDPSHFFTLFKTLLQRASELPSTGASAVDVPMDGTSILAVLVMRVEQYDPSDEEDVLSGYLQLIYFIVLNGGALGGDMHERILRMVTQLCLFRIPSAADPTEALCSRQNTRRDAFNVLRALCSKSAAGLRSVMEAVETFKSTGDFGEVENNFDATQLRRSSTGCVGLANQGATCYMNSTLQVLFADSITRGIVEDASCAGIEPLDGTDPGTATEEESVSPEQKSDETDVLMRQLQLTFRFLENGLMQSYNPRPLVMASKILNLQNDVLHQNDVRDFIDKLLDCMERGLESQSHLKAALKQRYVGSWCHETHRLGAAVPDEHKISQRHDPFVAIDASVRGYSSLEESLLASVQGERMEGENQLVCDFLPRVDGKSAKCNGLRRAFIEQLPDVLIIQLKRFQYDVHTYQMAKVKDRFSFPMTLNMKRYTRVGVEAADASDSANGAGVGSDTEAKSGAADEPTEPPAGESKTAQQPPSDPEYDYELFGIIVHNGTSVQSGHYYSFVRLENDSSWAKFDDKIVTPFNLNNLESECFGGTRQVPVIDNFTQQPIGNQMREELRDNSAYVLVYRRIQTVRHLEESTVRSEDQWALQRTRDLERIWSDNDMVTRKQMLFGQEFFAFMRDILVMVVSASEPSDSGAHINTAIDFFTSIVLKARNKSGIRDWVDVIRNLLASNFAASCAFLEKMSRGQIFSQLLRNSDHQVRKAFADICVAASICTAESEAAALAAIAPSAASKVNVDSQTGPLQAFLERLCAQLAEYSQLIEQSAWRRFGEFFGLLRDLASNASIRRGLCRLQFLEELVKFFCGTMGNMPSWLNIVKNPMYGKPDFTSLLECVEQLCLAPASEHPQSTIATVTQPQLITRIFSERTQTRVVLSLLKCFSPSSQAVSQAFVGALLKYATQINSLKDEHDMAVDGLMELCKIQDELVDWRIKYMLLDPVCGIISQLPTLTRRRSPICAFSLLRVVHEALKHSEVTGQCVESNKQVMQKAIVWLDDQLYTYHLGGNMTKMTRDPEKVAVLQALAEAASVKLFVQSEGGPFIAADGVSMFGWYPEPQEQKQHFGSQTIVLDCPAQKAGYVVEARLRLSALNRDAFPRNDLIGLGIFEEVPDVIKSAVTTAASVVSTAADPDEEKSAGSGGASGKDVETAPSPAISAVSSAKYPMHPPPHPPPRPPRFTIGQRVYAVVDSSRYNSLDEVPHMDRHRFCATIAGREHNSSIYKCVFDDGTVDPFIREEFISVLNRYNAPPAPLAPKKAVKLIRKTVLRWTADDYSIHALSVSFTLGQMDAFAFCVGMAAKHKPDSALALLGTGLQQHIFSFGGTPLLIEKGQHIGLFIVTYPPRVAYTPTWPRSQPYRYKLFIGQHAGAHPTDEGDIVYRMNYSDECPGVTFMVEHQDRDGAAAEGAADTSTPSLVCYGTSQQLGLPDTSTKSFKNQAESKRPESAFNKMNRLSVDTGTGFLTDPSID